MDTVPLSSGPLRTRGKARRVAEIVTAAGDLWREHGIENVSLNQIAAAAEVAPQTIYNLIGGVDAIGFAVIKEALARMDAQIAETALTGVELAIATARISAEVFIADAKLYRQVLVRVPRALFHGTHLGRDTADISIAAVGEAQAVGELVRTVDADWLGRSAHINFLGALYDWACGDSGNMDFLRRAEIAALAPLAACSEEAIRPAMTNRLYAALGPASAKIAVGEQ